MVVLQALHNKHCKYRLCSVLLSVQPKLRVLRKEGVLPAPVPLEHMPQALKPETYTSCGLTTAAAAAAGG